MPRRPGEVNPVANILPAERRLEVLAALVNGSGIRGAERMTGVHRDTIGRFAAKVGEGCARLHDRIVRDLACALVDMDEQHSWCFKRQQNVPEGAPDDDIGEQWTWAALCRTSKLTIAWVVGKRTQEHADELVADVRARLTVMPQICTDGLKLYESAIAVNFGPAVPYVQTIKRYTDRGSNTATGEKFSPKRGVDFIEKRIVSGTPDLDKATTYAVERSNGTNRQWNARLNRRTLKFSKDLDRHKASIALQYVYRNLCWVQRNMRVSAAMAAGVTDHLWELGELMEAALAEPSGEKPTAQPLIIPKPSGPARPLPGDRGWMRVVKGGGGPAPSPAPAPSPPAAPAVAASGGASPAEPAPAEPSPQLDLFAPRPARPLPPPGTQLTLFGEPPAGPRLS
jgi:IS1 family transposase